MGTREGGTGFPLSGAVKSHSYHYRNGKLLDARKKGGGRKVHFIFLLPFPVQAGRQFMNIMRDGNFLDSSVVK